MATPNPNPNPNPYPNATPNPNFVGENPTLNLNPTLNPKPNPDRYPYPGTSWQPTWALGGGPATAADLPRPRDHGASRGSSTSSQTELSEISELSEGSVMASDVVPRAPYDPNPNH